MAFGYLENTPKNISEEASRIADPINISGESLKAFWQGYRKGLENISGGDVERAWNILYAGEANVRVTLDGKLN